MTVQHASVNKQVSEFKNIKHKMESMVMVIPFKNGARLEGNYNEYKNRLKVTSMSIGRKK